jgi:hypothetical protein
MTMRAIDFALQLTVEQVKDRRVTVARDISEPLPLPLRLI